MQIATELPLLSILIATPLVASLVLWLVKPLHRHARIYGLVVSLVVLGGGVLLAAGFDFSVAAQQQYTELHSWIPQLGVSYALGVNGLGLAMVLLSALLVPIALLAGWREQDTVADGEVIDQRRAGFVALVLALQAVMVAVFSARDVFLFYVLFEAMLIPVYFLIGGFGGPRRRHAAVKFLLYSLAGGLIMLAGVVALTVLGPGGPTGMHIDTLAGAELGVWTERWIFLSFFVAFAIKAPMWPVHTWLPDATQQATPGTSALLVGVLDKVGTFGMMALCLPLFPEASVWASPVIIALAVVSIIYGGLLAVGQRDIMRLIAFTSVSHFGFIVLGIFIRDEVALTGAMLYMVAHGVSTAALFFVSGFLIERGGSQQISDFGGMQKIAPVLAGTFLIAGLSTAGLTPGLSGFVPEYLVLIGTFSASIPAGALGVLGIIIAAIYILLPYQRIFTGPPEERLVGSADLGARERWVIGPLVAAMLALGFYPMPVLDAVRPVAGDLSIEHVSSIPTGQTDSAGTDPGDAGSWDGSIVTAEGSRK